MLLVLFLPGFTHASEEIVRNVDCQLHLAFSQGCSRRYPAGSFGVLTRHLNTEVWRHSLV